MQQMTRRKRVPYSKNYVIRDHELPIAHLYFGPNAWGAKDDINDRCIILPPFEPPQNYDWRFLSGHIVIAHAMGSTETVYRKRIALEILLGGACQVHIFLPKIEKNDGARKVRNNKSGEITEYLSIWGMTPHERYYR